MKKLFIIITVLTLNACVAISSDTQSANKFESFIACGMSRLDIYSYKRQNTGINAFVCDIEPKALENNKKYYACYLDISGFTYKLYFSKKDELQYYIKGKVVGFTEIKYSAPIKCNQKKDPVDTE